MIEGKPFAEMTKQFTSLIPEGFQAVQKDIEAVAQSVMKAQFNKLELVTREEFDIQSQVLAKTRSKLELLEKKVAELERQLKIEP